jgi:hypothetical protein
MKRDPVPRSPRFAMLTRKVHRDSTKYSRAKFSILAFSSTVKGVCARFWRFSVGWPHELMASSNTQLKVAHTSTNKQTHWHL